MQNYNNFKEFLNNTAIKKISKNKKWTISKNKMPINFKALTDKNVIYGLKYMEDCVDLHEIDKFFVEKLKCVPQGITYKINAIEDGYVVIDIEPKCPNELKEKFLKMPYDYCEISSSGKGIHLLINLNKLSLDEKFNSIFEQKTVIKEDNGYYEVLIDHYCMFTGDMIKNNGNSDYEELKTLLSPLLEESLNKTNKKDKVNIEIQNVTDIPYQNLIVEKLLKQNYGKTLEDFADDNSRFEFGITGFYFDKLKKIVNDKRLKKIHEYSINELVHILYNTIKEIIPFREKHLTTRNDKVWLMYLAGEVIAKNY